LALAGSSIEAEQQSVVTANHQLPLSLARIAVNSFTNAIQQDIRAVAGDQAAQVRAEAAEAAATARLDRDQAELGRATVALDQANGRVADDRAKLGGIAIGLYTGGLTNPQPAGLPAPRTYEQQVLYSDEVAVVTGVVGRDLGADLAAAAADTRWRAGTAWDVRSDRQTAAQQAAAALAAGVRTQTDQGALRADQVRLDGADRQLNAAEGQLAAALHSLSGPASVPPGQVSILGGAALTATQLAGWFNSQGYVDFTSAPIEQLAAWYLQDGAEEGVRGDVAFAQAVLETGGFGSPDAVSLSNFAGIGHCDTCASGWPFPSPQDGVLGQVQLLRIFANSGPAPTGAPAPVLPALTTTKEISAGCCSTVESLTGVWATDPTYGQQILAIYEDILAYALSSPAD
jgi:hypothetical protein